MIEELGPMRSFSCRPLERMIGIVKQKIGSFSKPAENAYQIIRTLAEQSFLSRKTPACSKTSLTGIVIGKANSEHRRIAEFRHLGANFLEQVELQVQCEEIRVVQSITMTGRGCKQFCASTVKKNSSMFLAHLPISNFGGTEKKYYVVQLEFMFVAKPLPAANMLNNDVFAWARICSNIESTVDGNTVLFYTTSSNSMPLAAERDHMRVLINTNNIISPITTIPSPIEENKHYLVWPSMSFKKDVCISNTPFWF